MLGRPGYAICLKWRGNTHPVFYSLMKSTLLVENEVNFVQIM